MRYRVKFTRVYSSATEDIYENLEMTEKLRQQNNRNSDLRKEAIKLTIYEIDLNLAEVCIIIFPNY